MKWAVSTIDGACVAAPNGRVDESTWEVFLARLLEAVATAGDAGQRLVVDLSGVDYMSSRGLRALTMARREADGRKVAMQLANPNDRMREILAISRYDKIFDVVGAPGPAAA